MTVSTEARERVYLSYRAIFSGDNMHTRKKEKIVELVDKNKSSLNRILGDLGKEPVVNTLQSLLEKSVFESHLRAKMEFPDLFRSSAIRDAERQAFEDDAVNSTAEVLNEIAAVEGEEQHVEQQRTRNVIPEDYAASATSSRLLPSSLPD